MSLHLPSFQSLMSYSSSVLSFSPMDAIARVRNAEPPSSAQAPAAAAASSPPPSPASTSARLTQHLLHTSSTLSTLVSDLVHTFPLTSPMFLPDPAPPPPHPDLPPTSAALLLPEVMLQVFAFLNPEEVIRAGPVCKTWQEAATSPLLWTSSVCPTLAATCHCQLFNPAPQALPPPPPSPPHQPQQAEAPAAGLSHLGPPLTLPQLWLAFQQRNFLRNPGFQRLLNMDRAAWKRWRRNAWVLQTSGGDGISWEPTPAACAPVPMAPKAYPAGRGAGGVAARAQQQLQGLFGGEEQGCIASSSEWSEVMQVVDFVEELQRRGLSREQAEHVLDSGLPLGFSLEVGAHADSGGQFSVCMFLMEREPEDVSNIAQRFVAKPSRYHFYSGKLKTTAPGTWQRFAHVVDAVPRGFRFGIVLLRGKDQSSRRGHFGVKLACAQLTFLHQADKAAFSKGDDESSWVRRMVEAGLGPNQAAVIQAAAAAAPAPAAHQPAAGPQPAPQQQP